MTCGPSASFDAGVQISRTQPGLARSQSADRRYLWTVACRISGRNPHSLRLLFHALAGPTSGKKHPPQKFQATCWTYQLRISPAPLTVFDQKPALGCGRKDSAPGSGTGAAQGPALAPTLCILRPPVPRTVDRKASGLPRASPASQQPASSPLPANCSLLGR